MPLFKEKVGILGYERIANYLHYVFFFKFVSNNHLFVCNCRKLRIRRSIKVPAISNKVADIPADEFSWRKYGQKPIKGSPHPRY